MVHAYTTRIENTQQRTAPPRKADGAQHTHFFPLEANLAGFLLLVLFLLFSAAQEDEFQHGHGEGRGGARAAILEPRSTGGRIPARALRGAGESTGRDS